MKLEEVPVYRREIYQDSCQCGKIIQVLTQRNNFSEYETEIYILCECGEYLEFILPVN